LQLLEKHLVLLIQKISDWVFGFQFLNCLLFLPQHCILGRIFFYDAVKEKRLQIKEVRSHGLKQKSKSITSFSSGNSFINKDAEEMEEEKILSFMQN